MRGDTLRKETPWFIFWTVSYVLFMLLDLFDAARLLSSCIKYASMLACFAHVFFRRREDRVLLAAIGLTCVCDALLLFSARYTQALLLFAGVQILHAWRFTQNRKKFLLRLLAADALVLLFCVFVSLPILFSAVALYAENILVAFFCAMLRTRQTGDALPVVGMGLFLLCDVNVLLFNAGAFIPLPHGIAQASSVLMWFFYLPSQILLIHFSPGDQPL